MNKSGEESGEALLAKLQGLLTAAVVDRNYEEVARLAKLADEIRKLEDQEGKIAERRKVLAVSLQTSSFGNNENELLQGSESGESARERGARVRNHFVDDVLAKDGIRLVRLATKKYRTSGKRVVGITYARELDIRPDSWFLGLSDEYYDFVILLCDSASEEIAVFVLPTDVVRRIWNALSRSKGQVKFHIARTAWAAFELQLPGSRTVKLDEYLNATKWLRGA